jgi:hypothetical protein
MQPCIDDRILHRAIAEVGAGVGLPRVAVAVEQRARIGAYFWCDHPYVHLPFGQVTGDARSVNPGVPDPVERGSQHVEVVHDAEAVRQQGPGDSDPVVAAERADHEGPRVLLEPAVDVLVVQVDVLLPHPLHVVAGDAEFERHPLIEHGCWGVDPVHLGDAVLGDRHVGALDHDVPVDRGDLARRCDEVDLPCLLFCQQFRQVCQRGVSCLCL